MATSPVDDAPEAGLQSVADAVPDSDAHDLAVTMLAEVASEIGRADEKASLLIGSLGIAFSIVLSSMIGGDLMLDGLPPVEVLLWIVGGALSSASVVAAAMAVWPRLSKGPGPGTITYWGQVHGMRSPAEVGRALAERSLRPPERTYQQLLVLSAVVQRKYRCIRWSMLLAGAGIALILLAFLLA
jgi:hypothetical protein